jgi:glycerol-3-phosphate dehydrogenase (NAD(P)+)
VEVTVLGSGSWGTTLALVLYENNHRVMCWAYEKEVAEDIDLNRENSRFLPGIKIPDSIRFTNDLYQSILKAEVIVVAIPTQKIRSVFSVFQKKIPRNCIWVSVAKGIENKSLLRVSQILNELYSIDNSLIGVLAGPSHAEEVSRKIPTAVVAASMNIDTAKIIQDLFMNPYFRIYSNPDIIGVELGGALKNIIAIATGICNGAGFGDNTVAALMTRGLVEISRLGIKLGAQPDTFAGLSGMGDLIVTCMSRHSRNRYVGEQVGKGRKVNDVLNGMVMIAEGVGTTEAAFRLAKRENVEMPITKQVYKVLFEGKKPIHAVKDLMTRASKVEDWGK